MSEFSKLSMGPLWAEILEHIIPVIISDDDDRARPPSKMAVYSGHDTTLIQLLSSLGVWDPADWPPYASLMLIEIHEMVDDSYDKTMFTSGFAFRLIYDGKVLTPSVEGCDGEELCDAQVLLDHLTPIANRTIDCSLSLDESYGSGESAMKIAKSILSDTAGIILILVVIMLSALLGSTGTYFYLTGMMPTKAILPKRMTKKTAKDFSGVNVTSSSNVRASAGFEPFEIGMSDADDTGLFVD
jgi:hypothetical protein